MYSRPMKIRAKPTIISPKDLRRLIFENRSGNDSPIRGKLRALILTLNPKSDIIQAVMVVPILAPITTPIDSRRESKPALTKLTIITVVAEDDWIIAVIKIPVKTPFILEEVIAAKIFRSFEPATFCKDSLIIFIPNKNIPKEPISSRKSIILNSIDSGLCGKYKKPGRIYPPGFKNVLTIITICVQ